jgi:transposase
MRDTGDCARSAGAPGAGLPAYAPVTLVWCKRICCAEALCPRRTRSEEHLAIPPRGVLTARARMWATRRVGDCEDTVAVAGRELGVGWHTFWRAVETRAEELLADPARLDGVEAVGVDEHVWLHANPARRTQFATGIVDLTPTRHGGAARLLDVVAGRSGSCYADGLRERDEEWRQRIGMAALDPFRGCSTALRTVVPQAVVVLDAFHVVKLAGTARAEVRRRVQQTTLGHRGHKGDPLYQTRRLRVGADKLTDRTLAKLNAALAFGDPTYEVTIAWHVAEQVRAIYHAPTTAEGRRRAEIVLASLPSCPVPQIARLGRTLNAWRTELLAYFDTGGLQRSHRSDAPDHREDPPPRPRLPQLAQLQTATAPGRGVDWHTDRTPRIRTRSPRLGPRRPRRRRAGGADHRGQRPTLGGKPHFSLEGSCALGYSAGPTLLGVVLDS